MIEMLKSWIEFGLYLIKETPVLAVILQTYPIGCAFGIYWTQGIKRSQRKNKWKGRDSLTSLELRALSGCISAAVIFLLVIAFEHLPNTQIVAHSLLGGAACPMIMKFVIDILSVLAGKFPWAAGFVSRIKTGERRKTNAGPPTAGERRKFDSTGEFWSNDITQEIKQESTND